MATGIALKTKPKVASTMANKAARNGEAWLATAPVEDILSSFRSLMLDDVDRARCVFQGIKEAMNDPVLTALAAMPVEDELTPEEMEREIAQAVRDSKSGERVSAEDSKRKIFG